MSEKITTMWEVMEWWDLALIDENKLSAQEKFVLDILKDYEFIDTQQRYNSETKQMDTFTETYKADPKSLLKQIFDD